MREIKITARYAQFEPASITVKKGERVKLVITSVDVFHTFTSDELKLDFALNPGQTVEREFTAPSTGTFTFYCRPHRDSGMTGTLRVEE